LAGSTAFATFSIGIGLDRTVLWQVERACVADFKLIGTPFPCLEVDLSGGDERGNVVLRPPLLDDTILAPTRKITGVEDPFLQSPAVPNYFDAAWRAHTFLKGADGQAPERDAIALVVNSATVRGQEQLHIHVGCLLPYARSRCAENPDGQIGPVVRRTMFWGYRIPGTDLAGVNPFRLAAEAVAGKAGAWAT
jgi:CDP-diacylglycerol pyrophosphatase